MSEYLISLSVLISPVVYIFLVFFCRNFETIGPQSFRKYILLTSVAGIIAALIGGYMVYQFSLIELSIWEIAGLGISFRLDSISMLMFSMIAVTGFIVIRFSMNYLEGDSRQDVFLRRLIATLASVQLLILSGNLGMMVVSWVSTSICLHRLLVFYPDRPRAIIAARKKFIMARLGDLSLLISAIILYRQFGTGNLEVIFRGVKEWMVFEGDFSSIELVCILLVLAAIFKAAQFPTHGWLMEVMETPTPVSALLHAGLINAGPFLMIRMSAIMDFSYYSSLMLIAIGGFSAVFASVVFLTQTSIKTALSYSSMAHMGFSLMICGLGVYSAAMLHLIAHSFYKAHAFLSSGSTVEVLQLPKSEERAHKVSSVFIFLLVLGSMGIYTSIFLILGFNPYLDFGLMAVGGIIAIGTSGLLVRTFSTSITTWAMLRIGGLMFMIALVFFTLESTMSTFLGTQIPSGSKLGSLSIFLMYSIVLLLFGVIVVAQLPISNFTSSSLYKSMVVHLKNGLYINACFDRIIHAMKVLPSSDTGVRELGRKGTVSTYELVQKDYAEKVA
jgi:NAD(P)H-quinone oxidoreductase subunit 5